MNSIHENWYLYDSISGAYQTTNSVLFCFVLNLKTEISVFNFPLLNGGKKIEMREQKKCPNLEGAAQRSGHWFPILFWQAVELSLPRKWIVTQSERGRRKTASLVRGWTLLHWWSPSSSAPRPITRARGPIFSNSLPLSLSLFSEFYLKSPFCSFFTYTVGTVISEDSLYPILQSLVIQSFL